MNEKRRLVKNTLLITIGNIGTKIVSFLLLPLYTSILSTSEYGLFDFIIAISAFLLPIVTFSMHEAMFRFIIDIDKKKDERGFKRILSTATVTILIGIFILFISILVLYFIISENNKYLLLYLFFYVSANVFYTFSNYLLRGLGKIKEYAIITSVKNILQLVVNVIVVVIFRFGIKGLLISSCLSEVIAFATVLFFSKIWKYISFKLISKKELLNMLKYSIPLIPNALCNQIINISDRFIITSMMNASFNGIYSVSYKFPNMIETLYHYFYTAWSESASRIFKDEKEKALDYYQSLYITLNNIIFSVILIIISLMPLLFRIFIRGEYVEGFRYVPILMIAMYFDCIAKFYSGIFTALKKTKTIASTTAIAALINILINILLITKIGLYAAALSTLIAEVILVILRKNKLKEDFKISLGIRNKFAMISMLIVVLALYNYDNLLMTIISVLVTILYSFFTNKKTINIVIHDLLMKVKLKRIKEA